MAVENGGVPNALLIFYYYYFGAEESGRDLFEEGKIGLLCYAIAMLCFAILC